jgi:hypothetical protein
MILIDVLIPAAILWFLITLFTRSRNSSRTLTETGIVVIGMLMVGLLTRWFLSDFIGLLTSAVNVVALYFLVDKVCGTSRAITIRICVWYFVISFFIGLFFRLMAS